jgi:hypothetical protein
MEKSESIKEIATALCKFQGEVEKIKKTETNPFFKSKYASLSDILDVIRKPLSENGLSFVQFPTEQHKLTTMLMHISGEYLQDTYDMTPTKNDPQGLGSVITYQRRYALGSILGLNIDDDDDGNSGSTPKPTNKKTQETPKVQPQSKPALPNERFLKLIENIKVCNKKEDIEKQIETAKLHFELSFDQILTLSDWQ